MSDYTKPPPVYCTTLDLGALVGFALGWSEGMKRAPSPFTYPVNQLFTRGTNRVPVGGAQSLW